MPTEPTPLAARAVLWTLNLAKELRPALDGLDIGLDIRFVLRRVRANTILGRTARDALTDYGVRIARTEIHERTAVATAAGFGRSVFDMAPDSLAAAELDALAREFGREVFRHGREGEEGPSERDARRD